MAKDYNIKLNPSDTILTNKSLGNAVPIQIPNTLQNAVGPLFKIPHPTVTQVLLDYLPFYQIKPSKVKPDTTELKSKLNTPVFGAVTLIGLSSDVKIYEGNSTQTVDSSITLDDTNTEEVSSEILWLMRDAIVTVSQTKKIVTTEIAGNNGTVKEYIGLGDFEVTITGRLTGAYGQRPQNALKTLKSYLDVNKTIGIGNEYLEDLGITEIVISDYDLPQLEGQYSTQVFTINAISDTRPEDLFLLYDYPPFID